MRPLVALLTTVAVSLATAALALAGDDAVPRHVTQVSGSRDHGFHVVWSDGEQWWTPTLSEELALCQDYGRPVRRGRCRATTRTTYRWIGIVKRSLRHHAG